MTIKADDDMKENGVITFAQRMVDDFQLPIIGN
jgi:hypothetical protein